MRIEVTAELIAEVTDPAYRDRADKVHACLIATAVSRALPDTYVACGLSTIGVGDEIFDLPDEASNAVVDWLNRQPIEPFAFELPIEEAV